MRGDAEGEWKGARERDEWRYHILLDTVVVLFLCFS